MTYNKISPLTEYMVSIFNPTAGSSSGSNAFINFPFKGQVVEAGFLPQAAITSNTTLRVQTAVWTSSTASTLTEIVTSTLGTFNSNQLVAGQVQSVTPPSPAYGNYGDVVMLTTSGGQSSTIGATIYTIFRRAV